MVAIIKTFFINNFSESCIDAAGTECLACTSSDHRTFDSSTGKCPCDDGYYDDGNDNSFCPPCNNDWYL